MPSLPDLIKAVQSGQHSLLSFREIFIKVSCIPPAAPCCRSWCGTGGCLTSGGQISVPTEGRLESQGDAVPYGRCEMQDPTYLGVYPYLWRTGYAVLDVKIQWQDGLGSFVHQE